VTADRALIVGSLSAIVAATLFALLGPLTRAAAEQGLGAIGFVAWRAGVGAVAVVAGMVVAGTAIASLEALRDLGRRDRAALAVASLMGLTLNVAIFLAFGRIAIGLALMLFYTYPAMVAAVGVLAGREPLTRVRAVALGLATFGAALVLVGGLGPAAGVRADLVGVILGLVAALGQTVFITLSRVAYRSVPAEGATLVVLVVAFAGAAAIAVVTGVGSELAIPFATPGAAPIVLVAGVLCAALPSFLFLSAIRRIGATRTGILMLWEPVVGVVLAAALLAEALLPIQLLGGGLVIAAAVILQVVGEPDSKPVVPEAELV
jgi:drug/metabolite transporter (DMT)-like permease